MAKIVSAREAVSHIKDGDTVSFNGFAQGFGFAETVARELGERYEENKSPKDLTFLFASGCGDLGKSDFALDHFAKEGMVKKIYAGHVGLAKKLSAMINENKIQAYNIPQGVVTHLFRAIAGKKEGVITHVGLETFADPKLDGGKMNSITTEDYVREIEINSKRKLFYPSMKVDVAIIRGTVADEDGNISIEKEGVNLETLHIAQAAKNSGGIVIAQVKEITQRRTLKPTQIKIPSILVDYVVKAEEGEHRLSAGCDYDPSYTGEILKPLEDFERMPLNVRKIISKRCAMELKKDTVINLGIGVPEGIASVAQEEGIDSYFTMTIESGLIGGIPGSGAMLGASVNVISLMGHDNMFDFYDGGGLDHAFLGLAQADKSGNINVSKFSGRMVGCGGFVNITQNTKNVVFCGTFTAGGLKVNINDGKLSIEQEGKVKKFINNVEQVTFSAKFANDTGQKVLYVTERCVFELNPTGLVLVEIAPGIDLQKDIIDQMEFEPIISKDLKEMDSIIFSDELMNLKERS